MSGARILRTSLRCQSCQWHALSAFASVAGVSLSAARPAASRGAVTAMPRYSQMSGSRRAFATRDDTRRPKLKEEQDEMLRDLVGDELIEGAENEPPSSEATSSPQDPKDPWYIQEAKAETSENEVLRDIAAEEGIEDVENEPPSSQVTSTPQDPTVPWYLQVDQPERRPQTLAERQKLPNVPEEAPENLGAMMEHLFTDIGLDDIRVLDLRKMDPPQALGANLIMLFGTARSEKHLHTSADRFCRWLRSQYKLRPYADGLLGRNELKIRLRRKAKRAKLLGSKGTPEGEVDDGIRTGWVCVNVGSIEKGEEVTAADLQARGIIGFGEGIAGAHLVVQMMTEEKREEMNLEKLWIDALARQERKEARLEQELAAEEGVSASDARGSVMAN